MPKEMLRSPAFAFKTLYNFNIEKHVHQYNKFLSIELPLAHKFITLT